MNISLPTPCHILDLDRLEQNLAKIELLKQRTDCRVLLAIKGFSSPSLFPRLRHYLDGISASGLFEARLGREQFGSFVQTFSPAFTKHNISQIAHLSNRVIFNSVQQFLDFHDIAKAQGCDCGLRINPECSVELRSGIDPCQSYSRLGVRCNDLKYVPFSQISGLHLHTMCEQQADVLAHTVEHLINHYDYYLHRIRWLNLGGGQLFGDSKYDLDLAIHSLNRLHEHYDLEIFLEPCEGIFTDVGYFASTVVDIVENEKQIAILDSSAVCHFPDAPYRGWEREILGADQDDCVYSYELAGPTCYAGDIFGTYSFRRPLKIGDILYFQDTAAYSMVKSNMFNGIPLPTLAFYSKQNGLVIQKSYGYSDYLSCL